MMRFAVFITATFGYFLRKLRFVVTPKTMGQEKAATRRTLWPQYLVLSLNAVAIPIGIVMHWRAGALPLGALVANVIWAALTFGVAALAIRYALRAANFHRREYRFPLPVPMRIESPSGRSVCLATDISPLGCRLIGDPVGHAVVGDELRGELLLPTGPLPVSLAVRALLTSAAKDAPAAVALGCEFRWGLSDERNRLEMFLFGSDLQWRLNGFEDRIHTPLERLGDALGGVKPPPRHLARQRWAPLLYRRVDPWAEAGVGFISAADAKAGVRTVVSLGALPPDGRLVAEEVTPSGPRGVVGRVAEGEVLETHAAPIYLYRLTA